MIRDLLPDDREVFLSMAEKFYSSTAVAYSVDSQNFRTTFDVAMSKSPFIRLLIIEEEGTPVGYALLSFTYSNEAGGIVVLVEELYIGEAYRNKGFGSRFFEFLELEYPLAKRFRLEVRGDNKKAIELYNRLGYNVFNYVQMVKDVLH